jgi:branched-chain amino acid transport system permease protein
MSTKTDAPATTQKPPAGAGLAAPATDWRKIVGWTILGLAAVIAPFVAGRLWTGILTQGVIIAIGALGLNVLTGYTGLASLGHSFFLGVGAYTAAFFGGNLGWSFLLWLPLAGIVAGLVGLGVGALTLRFRGLYLTMVTLGLVFIGVHIFLSLRDLSGGSQGRSFPAPALGDFKWNDATSTLGPLEFTRDQKFYFLALPLLVLIVLFTSNMMKTRIGRAFQAVRDRQVAAELMGINAANTKIIAFVFSSVLAGICGALFASHLRRVQPDFWSLELAILFIAMIIIGGIATVGGSILGALLLMALPQIVETFAEFLPFVQQGVSGGGITKGDLTEIIYALFLALFLVFEPTGLVGIYRRVTGRFSKR